MAVAEPFQLNSQRIIQILSDPDFYTECVAYLFLQEMAYARCQQYEVELMRVHDKGCAGCEDQSQNIIGPAIAEFVRHTYKLSQRDPQLLLPLHNYLCRKLGYEPSAFVLYYKESKQRKKLTF